MLILFVWRTMPLEHTDLFDCSNGRGVLFSFRCSSKNSYRLFDEAVPSNGGGGGFSRSSEIRADGQRPD
jgi:hypothetical protein